MKILIIRFSSIGDIVLTSPVIRALKQQIPDSEIHYLTKSAFREIIDANQYVDNTHILSENISQTIAELKSENFDLIIDLHKNLRSKRIISGLKARSITFDKLNLQKWLAVNLKWTSILPNKHIVDRYFDALTPLGIQNDGQGLDFYIPQSMRLNFELPSDFVAFSLAAQHDTKRFPIYKVAEVIKYSSNKHFILLGGKRESDMGIRLSSDYPNATNLCGKLTLLESALVISRAAKLITNDTGLMHIGAALKIPIASIWGNTIPEFGMYPYFGGNFPKLVRKSTQFEVNGLSCRPCSKIGFDKCPKGHFNCMQLQDSLSIAAWLD